MMEYLVLAVIVCIFWGVTSACFRMAVHATIRNDLFRCRDRLFQLAINGDLNPKDPAFQELADFIHTLITYSEHASLMDYVIAQINADSEPKRDLPSFFKDEKLKPIADDAATIAMKGMLYSSWLLTVMWFVVFAFVKIYKPLNKYVEQHRKLVKQEVFAKAAFGA